MAGRDRRLAAVVRDAVAGGELPVVLAGSCNAALGVVGGFEHAGCGAVWLDAHGDFNTPASSVTGFVPGMTLAALVGDCLEAERAEIGDRTPIAPDAVALLGVRDLSPEAERERLCRSGIHAVGWRDAAPEGDVVGALDAVAARVEDVYLHVDLDAFAPEVAPGIVDEPVPGGLSLADAEGILGAVADRFRVRAATVATYTPARDRDDRTLRVALRLLERLGREVPAG